MLYNLECVNHKDYSKILTFKNYIKNGDNYFLDITTIDELNELVLNFGPIIIEQCINRFTIVIGSSEELY
jgi:hypothetical protein